MHSYALISIINTIVFLGLGFFVYLKKRKGAVQKHWLLFMFCAAGWSFGTILANNTQNAVAALFWYRVLNSFALFVPAFFLQFLRTYCVEENHSVRKNAVLFLVSSALLTATFIFPQHFVYAVTPGKKIFFSPMPGFIYHSYAIYFFVIVIYCHIELYRAFKSANAKKRNALKYLFIAMFIAFTGGSSTFLITYGVEFLLGNYFLSLFAIIMSYAIVAHRLLDIEVVIKRTVVFAGLFGMVMGVVAIVTTVTQAFAERFFQVPATAATAISVIVVILLYDPSRKFLVYATDRFLFQKKENIGVILNRLSENIVSVEILDIEEAGKNILFILADMLRLESASIIIKDENNKAYQVLHTLGVKKPEQSFSAEDFLIGFLSQRGKVVNLEQPQEKMSLPVECRRVMDLFKAVIAMPLFFQKELLGVLFLGKKKSDQEFSQDEIDYFPTISSQVALALRNARLYDILKKSQVDFVQQSKMASIGTLSAGISHEIKNPLNNMSGAVGVMKLNKKHGFLENLTKEEFEKEAFEVFDIVEENVKRANSVIERLSAMAKKPKELKVEPVNLHEVADEVMSFLDNEYNSHQIQLVKNYVPDLPMIMADRHAVEEVLLNLLVNARHAIGDNGVVTLSSFNHHKEVEMIVQDTGCGIPKENLEKIFDPFFTTKDTTRNPDKSAIKGTGLGLYLVREIARRYGGRIQVTSEVGKGTQFHVFFPVIK